MADAAAERKGERVIPSNLGQIIGRLTYGELEPRRKPELTTKTRREQALEFAQGSPYGFTRAEMAEALGITSAHASVLMFDLRARGLISRSGNRGSLRYAAVGPDSHRGTA